MTPYFMMSSIFSTFSMSAATPEEAMAFSASA